MIKTLFFCLALISVRPARAADARVDFARDVQPILKQSCMGCHSLDVKKKHKPASKFRLDDEKAALEGGKYGPDIVPGNAKGSLLYKLLLGTVPRPRKTEDEEDEIEAMPKHKKGEDWKPLTKDKVEVIKNWIDQGAKWSS